MPGKSKKRTAIPLESLSREIQQHLTAIGAGTIEDYLDWCRSHGFRASYRKSPRQLREERERATELCREHSLHEARRLHRPDRLLRRILAGDCEGVPAPMQGVCLAIHGDLHPRPRREFTERMLRHLSSRCPRFVRDRVGRTNVLALLVEMGEYHEHVVREIEEWRPRSHNAARSLAALARHLFALWEVPVFLDSAWHESSDESRRARGWFLHVASGKNIRTADLPIPYTRKMAHHFMRAPRDYNALEAVRWGQVHALGGDARLVGALRGTRLCEDFAHDEFWSTVLRFFIRNPMLDTEHVGPIIDYLHHHRFQPEQFVDEQGRLHTLAPPQPGLSMSGRTPRSLLARVEAWHRRLGRGSRESDNAEWPASGFPPFRSVEGTGEGRRVWTIRELRSPAQLQAEGAKLNHCVATYAASCRFGRASIWTLECESQDGVRKLLTIEVRHDRRQIVQARGKLNRLPTAQVRTVMARWASAVGLSLASWI